MAEKLNIDSFNEIVLKCIPEEKHEEFIATELETAYAMKIQAMEKLVELLNNQKPYHKTLEEVNNIDSNCERIAEILKDAQRANHGRKSNN